MSPKDFYRNYKADDTYSLLSAKLFREILAYEPIHVLEFGCGTGKHLDPMNRDGIVTIGIDISPFNIAKAIHKYDLPCVICSDETYLRNLCNVDVVFTCSVLDHIEDVAGIIDEFKRISNKAVILAETKSEGLDFYYAHDYESLGFEAIEFEWAGNDKCVYKIWIWEKES